MTRTYTSAMVVVLLCLVQSASDRVTAEGQITNVASGGPIVDPEFRLHGAAGVGRVHRDYNASGRHTPSRPSGTGYGVAASDGVRAVRFPTAPSFRITGTTSGEFSCLLAELVRGRQRDDGDG